MDFKIGDRVRIKGSKSMALCSFAGKEGIVEDIGAGVFVGLDDGQKIWAFKHELALLLPDVAITVLEEKKKGLLDSITTEIMMRDSAKKNYDRHNENVLSMQKDLEDLKRFLNASGR